MDEKEIDLSKLSRKERREFIKEQNRQNQEKKQRKDVIVKWGIIGAVIVLAVLGASWFFKEASKPLPGTQVEDQGRDHVSKEEWEKFKYNSDPPTSGPHDAEWIKPGVYTKPQGDGHLVHSLEHGYVIISYRCEAQIEDNTKQNLGTESAQTNKDCLDFVERLKERVEKDSQKLILVPRPNLDADFALTAWTRIDKFNLPAGKAGTEDVNMDRVENFISALRNHGPEKTME